jgi:hypothetical protein
MTIEEARRETRSAWERSYSPERNREAVEAIREHPVEYRISLLVARLFFRGIYFPQMTRGAWARLLYENRRVISALTREGFATWRLARRRSAQEVAAEPTTASAAGD